MGDTPNPGKGLAALCNPAGMLPPSNLSENLQGGNAITLLKANERTSQAQQGLIGTRALLPADQQT
ncbi:hypothetical protein, partial [Dictyobacter arantiisoli]|uniref:hypothetical protein n=1 Tax=Dictyobacter arantiisoli TaxID=2014874 RepID=UPI001C0EC3C1